MKDTFHARTVLIDWALTDARVALHANRKGTATRRRVLAALAARANLNPGDRDRYMRAWPSQAYLADTLGLSIRTIKYVLDSLDAVGVLTKGSVRGKGAVVRNYYALNVPRAVTGAMNTSLCTRAGASNGRVVAPVQVQDVLESLHGKEVGKKGGKKKTDTRGGRQEGESADEFMRRMCKPADGDGDES